MSTLIKTKESYLIPQIAVNTLIVENGFGATQDAVNGNSGIGDKIPDDDIDF